ncbi:MAG TPA: sulfatase/phosphatase domain-containing protein, partial [Planctomicrobium sp.]|nr:sulfatase/phosphatase domain-containing protein [Planctomicrobium sp.]
KHDPAQAPLPAYHPDTPEAREDWAQYHDNITDMDTWFGQQLQHLKDQGLAENTIVFFYGDHGSGMPRDKRWLYNSGLRVPLLIHVPERFRHLIPQDVPVNGSSQQLVSFVDLTATVISLAGQKPPEHLQGNAFLGPYADPPQRYAYGFRGRMDERIDFSRTVRNERYHYIRNYLPHRIQGEYLSYMFQTPTTQKWRELFRAGKLNETQSRFWQPKPAEELYDIENDPEEIHNLADSAEHAEILNGLRQAHVDHVLRIRDVGFLPEAELHRHAKLVPYDLGHDPELYPLEEILRMADAASRPVPDASSILAEGLKHTDGTVRYWAVTGLLIRGKEPVLAHQEPLRTMLRTDPSPSVRIVTAEALGRYGDDEDLSSAVECLIELADSEKQGPYHSLAALNAVDHLKEKSPSVVEQVRQLSLPDKFSTTRGGNYPRRMADAIIAESK